jgi:hypothetical protein
LCLKFYLDEKDDNVESSLRFELANQMKNLSEKIKIKERQQQERNLINKRAVLNLIVHKEKTKSANLPLKPTIK